MKRFLLTTLLVLSTSCAGKIPPVIQDFGQCLSSDIAPQVQSIISSVENALASGDYMTLLTDLAKQVGFTVVDCAVSEVTKISNTQAAASPTDQLSKTKSANGVAWLTRK